MFELIARYTLFSRLRSLNNKARRSSEKTHLHTEASRAGGVRGGGNNVIRFPYWSRHKFIFTFIGVMKLFFWCPKPWSDPTFAISEAPYNWPIACRSHPLNSPNPFVMFVYTPSCLPWLGCNCTQFLRKVTGIRNMFLACMIKFRYLKPPLW